MNHKKLPGRQNNQSSRNKLQGIKRKKQDKELDNRLKNTFPASDATAEY